MVHIYYSIKVKFFQINELQLIIIIILHQKTNFSFFVAIFFFMMCKYFNYLMENNYCRVVNSPVNIIIKEDFHLSYLKITDYLSSL